MGKDGPPLKPAEVVGKLNDFINVINGTKDMFQPEDLCKNIIVSHLKRMKENEQCALEEVIEKLKSCEAIRVDDIEQVLMIVEKLILKKFEDDSKNIDEKERESTRGELEKILSREIG